MLVPLKIRGILYLRYQRIFQIEKIIHNILSRCVDLINISALFYQKAKFISIL